jgi:hypothetical protein
VQLFWVIMFLEQRTHTKTAKIECRLQFDLSVEGEDNWRDNTVCSGCVWSWTNSQNLFDMLISNLYPILVRVCTTFNKTPTSILIKQEVPPKCVKLFWKSKTS